MMMVNKSKIVLVYIKPRTRELWWGKHRIGWLPARLLEACIKLSRWLGTEPFSPSWCRWRRDTLMDTLGSGSPGGAPEMFSTIRMGCVLLKLRKTKEAAFLCQGSKKAIIQASSFSPEDMEVTMRAYWAEGSQIHVHTNGDLAMQVRLQFLKAPVPILFKVIPISWVLYRSWSFW